MNQYEIIVLDLDGTLTNRDKVITPKTKEALLEIQRRGKKIVLASGRPTQGGHAAGEGAGTGPVRQLYSFLQWRHDYRLQDRRGDFFTVASCGVQ